MIRRDLDAAGRERFDLIVVGAGIHGAAAALAAARRGHRVLVLERDDFGGATSWNSLRVLHGGLRYLQTLDLPRFRASVRARSWYFDELAELVEPLPCLMPLYGRGLRRPGVLRPVLSLNERLRRRWSSAAELKALSPGRVLAAAQVVERFPGVRREGLRGGALWFDGFVPRPQRVVIEILRRAAARGAMALNYVEVIDWRIDGGRVSGVRARDRIGGCDLGADGAVVLNCAGPWAARLAARADPALAEAYHPSLAFNLLLDRPLESSVSVAVEPAAGGPTFFLHPMGGRTLAGTFHAPLEEREAAPTDHQVAEFVAALRSAVPGFDPRVGDVLRVLAGELPARRPGTAELATRDLRLEASSTGGPAGLHTLVGIKYTTAPLAAEAAVTEAMGGERLAADTADPPPAREVPDWAAFEATAERNPEEAGGLLDAIVREESVVEPDDLLLRRTDWGLDPRARELAEARVRLLRPNLFSGGG